MCAQVAREPSALGQEGLSVFTDFEELGMQLGGTGKSKMVRACGHLCMLLRISILVFVHASIQVLL